MWQVFILALVLALTVPARAQSEGQAGSPDPAASSERGQAQNPGGEAGGASANPGEAAAAGEVEAAPIHGGSDTAAQGAPTHKKSHKRVVREGGTAASDPLISPGIKPEDAARIRDNTDKLLATTDSNLKKLSEKALDSQRQSVIEQIKVFMQQAKTAMQEGDLQRGHTLALKAQLLSDDLVKN